MAVNFPLTIDQDTNVVIPLQINALTNPLLPFNTSTNPLIPVNITSYTYAFNAGPDYVTTPVLTKSSSSGITITNAAAGQAQLAFVPADTAAIDFGNSNETDSYGGVYDIYQTDSLGNVTRLWYGTFTINRKVA